VEEVAVSGKTVMSENPVTNHPIMTIRKPHTYTHTHTHTLSLSLSLYHFGLLSISSFRDLA
jgi:hypothetical protein